LDFRPRRERFAEALRALLRALFRDAAAAEQKLDRALAQAPEFGCYVAPPKTSRAKAAPQKGDD
jgi:hypothetical protein